jgi:hypothetical protein
MAFNGSGTYVLTAGQPVVAGTDILDSTFNTLTADLATALSTCVTRDGQSPPTANLPMGSFKLTGLSAGTAAGHSVRFEQLQTGTNKLITVAGTADVITGTMTPTYTAYTNGDMFTFIVGSTNTTNVTINIDGLGAKAITNGTTALTAGELTASRVVVVQYDGTRFQLLNSYLVTPITGTTGSAVMPSGTTAQRDGSPSAGYIRYNTTTATFEGYGSAWGSIGGGGVTTFNGSTTGLTPATATSGAITLGGTLGVANGGTGVTTSTGSGANVLGTSPTLVTPLLGTPTSGNLANCTGIPAPAALSTASGSAPSYSARAWVNFDGTGTVAIRASGNVSSITDNGTGDYTVNFTTAMPDANYAFTGGYLYDVGGGNGTGNGAVSGGRFSGGYTTSLIRVATRGNDAFGTALDPLTVTVAIFR